MHCGYVVRVESLRPHTNADKLQIATFFGNDTIVDLSVKLGDVGVYFPCDLQLSEEYCEVNNLVRKKDANGKEVGGYLDPEKRNIKAIKLRGEKSDGMFMPIHSLNYCFANPENQISIVAGQAADKLSVGSAIDVVNKHEICKKYIPKNIAQECRTLSGNKVRKHHVLYAPLFTEHADTEQLAYNLNAFHPGDEVEITLKMHGTSQRTANLPKLTRYKKSLMDKIFHREGTPVYEYGYVSGTRRVVMQDFEGESSFYGSNEFREPHHNAFVGKLMRGETVYYEVVGFTHTGAPIMSTATNNKVGQDFVTQYGEETIFSYDCTADGSSTRKLCGTDEYGDWKIPLPGKQSDLYVYRMTITTEEGFTVEYTPDFMRHRCEQMGVKTVPVFEKFIIPRNCENPGQYVLERAEKYYDGPDPVGRTHVREGVVCRILNRPKFSAFKHKNFSFKVLSGIAIETADTTSMTEDILSEL